MTVCRFVFEGERQVVARHPVEQRVGRRGRERRAGVAHPPHIFFGTPLGQMPRAASRRKRGSRRSRRSRRGAERRRAIGRSPRYRASDVLKIIRDKASISWSGTYSQFDDGNRCRMVMRFTCDNGFSPWITSQEVHSRFPIPVIEGQFNFQWKRVRVMSSNLVIYCVITKPEGAQVYGVHHQTIFREPSLLVAQMLHPHVTHVDMRWHTVANCTCTFSTGAFATSTLREALEKAEANSHM